MPGEARWRGGLLEHALTSNKINTHDLDDRARNILKLVKFCAKSGVPENAEVEGLSGEKTADLLRQCAADSIVLMKNDKNVLPLKKDKSVSAQM
jgi:beta-glucosidase